jgi:hypothetical protein
MNVEKFYPKRCTLNLYIINRTCYNLKLWFDAKFLLQAGEAKDGFVVAQGCFQGL